MPSFLSISFEAQVRSTTLCSQVMSNAMLPIHRELAWSRDSLTVQDSLCTNIFPDTFRASLTLLVLHISSVGISETLGRPCNCFPHVFAICSITCCMHSTSSRVQPTRRHPRRCHFVEGTRPWHMIAGKITSSDSMISRVL